MLVTVAEVEARTGQTYTGAELTRVTSFITDITAAIETYCRRTFTEPVPTVVKAVALVEIRRLLNTEPGVSNERIADLSTGYAYGGAAVLLSNAAKSDLDDYMSSIRPRWGSIQLVPPYSHLLAPPPEEPTP
jgi:hypothetical protein